MDGDVFCGCMRFAMGDPKTLFCAVLAMRLVINISLFVRKSEGFMLLLGVVEREVRHELATIANVDDKFYKRIPPSHVVQVQNVFL